MRVAIAGMGVTEQGVRLGVPEHYFRQLRRGAAAPVTVDAYPGLVLDGSVFSVASTTPFFARMPSDVAPACTAASACLICTSSPLELKVVSE